VFYLSVRISQWLAMALQLLQMQARLHEGRSVRASRLLTNPLSLLQKRVRLPNALESPPQRLFRTKRRLVARMAALLPDQPHYLLGGCQSLRPALSLLRLTMKSHPRLLAIPQRRSVLMRNHREFRCQRRRATNKQRWHKRRDLRALGSRILRQLARSHLLHNSWNVRG
jgi:hypothetical protein